MEEQRIQGIADLYHLVRLYKESLDRLQRRLKMMNGQDRTSKGVNLSNQIIAILHLRDEIEGLKGIAENQKANDIYHEIVIQDLRLKRMSSLVAKSHNFAEIRDLIKPPVERWWWHPIHPCARLDPVFSVCSIACLIVSLALSIDLIPRFFAGGVDLWGGLATIATPLAGWAFGKEALESAPRSKAFLERAMAAFEIPLKRRQLVVFISSVLFLLISCVVSGMREKISDNYYCMALKMGDDQAKSKNCCKVNKSWLTKIALKIKNPDPEANLKVAVALDPSNVDALFELGWLYEGRQEIGMAQEKYKIAAYIGHLNASNRLAVLQILENSTKSVEMASETLLNSRTKKKLWMDSEDVTRRDWHVTLAWARYTQGREKDSLDQLQLAKKIASKIPESEMSLCINAAINQKASDRNEKEKKSNKQLLEQWKKCQNESPTNREEDFWVGQAGKCIHSIINNSKYCLVGKSETDKSLEK
jgi:tetratricopeptide (TPR) repeat protein